jgi:replication factor C subunit 3/5
MSEYCPFVEKHRPNNFNDIVMTPFNKKILTNIIETSYFPNLLFYGPPGTGKTTTIINLINAYQEKLNNKDSGLMIHLNASDERGIDIIRNQINMFVNSHALFNTGMKFVILDEVDYMTKNAQQALRYLLQTHSNSVRFCLICNYISKIDEGLQNEFLRLCFNKLPQEKIVYFLKKIVTCENLNINENSLVSIQRLYKSDMRSMINFIQSNQNILDENIMIIHNDIWESLLQKLINKEKIQTLNAYLKFISDAYNIDKKNIIKDFLNYIIRKKTNFITREFLSFSETIMHFQECINSHYVTYSLLRLSSIFSSLS